MNKTIPILFFLFTLLTCVNSSKKVELIIESRVLFSYYSGSESPIEKYQLTIQENDNSIKYQYENISDKEKNMVFLFDKKSSRLISFNEEYVLLEKNIFRNYKISELQFDSYVLKEPYDDATGPILFNKIYGIIGIGNVAAPDFIYLPNDKKQSLKEILKILNQ